MKSDANTRTFSPENKLNTSREAMFIEYQSDYEHEWSEGRAMTIKQSIEYALE